MPGTIQPAPEVLLCHGAHAVTLRASLRAAVALDTLPGGISAVWDGLARQKLTTLHAVIRACATDRAAAERLLVYAAKEPLAPFQGPAQAACLALLSVILRTDAGEAPAPSSGAVKPISDHLADLYRYGTGWLGWPPSEVWNASPAELEAAILAHFDRLMKMTPGGDAPEDADKEAQRQANITAGLDPEFDREALRALKAKHHA